MKHFWDLIKNDSRLCGHLSPAYCECRERAVWAAYYAAKENGQGVAAVRYRCDRHARMDSRRHRVPIPTLKEGGFVVACDPDRQPKHMLCDETSEGMLVFDTERSPWIFPTEQVANYWVEKARAQHLFSAYVTKLPEPFKPAAPSAPEQPAPPRSWPAPPQPWQKVNDNAWQLQRGPWKALVLSDGSWFMFGHEQPLKHGKEPSMADAVRAVMKWLTDTSLELYDLLRDVSGPPPGHVPELIYLVELNGQWMPMTTEEFTNYKKRQS